MSGINLDLNWSTTEQTLVQLISAEVGTTAKKIFNAKTRELAETIAGRGPYPIIGVVHADFTTEGQSTQLRLPVNGVSRFLVMMWIASGKGPVEAIEAGSLQAKVRRAVVNKQGTPAGMMVGRFYLESETTESVDGTMIFLASTFGLPISMSVD